MVNSMTFYDSRHSTRSESFISSRDAVLLGFKVEALNLPLNITTATRWIDSHTRPCKLKADLTDRYGLIATPRALEVAVCSSDPL